MVRPMEPIDMMACREVESLGAFGIDPDAFGIWDLAKEKHSYTITTQKGDIVACAGVVEHFAGYGVSWVMMTELARKHMTQLIHIVRNFLWLSHFRRIEATVDTRFRDGHRLVKVLGFMKDCVLRGYSESTDYVLYSIVKKEGAVWSHQ